MNDDLLQRIWQSAPTRKEPLSMEAIMMRSQGLRRRVRIRNLTESVACAILLFAFGGMARAAGSEGDGFGVVAGVLGVAGALFVLVELWRRAGNLKPPADDAPTASFIARHREELVHQHAALSTVVRWYVAPMLPASVALMWAGFARVSAAHPERSWAVNAAPFVATLLFVALLSVFVVWLNKRAARKLEALLAELDD